MTDEEKLFEMVERCVADAVLALENDTPLPPFAKLLAGDDIHDLPCDAADEKQCYEALLNRLRAEVRMGDIDAVALTARVTIPEHFDAPTRQGLRIHVEEAARAHEKLSAKLLYIPYELFAAEAGGKRSVMLHTPVAVGMPMEVYGLSK